MKKGLGEIERMLFAYMQMREQTMLRAGDLIKPLRLTAPRERNLLSRLAKAGWIARVRDANTETRPSLVVTSSVPPNRLSATLIKVRRTAPMLRSPEIRLL